MQRGACGRPGEVRTTRGLHQDGRRLYVDMSFSVVKDAAGKVISDSLVGSMIRFDTATINALYPNGKAEFLSKFNTAADARVAEGYLLAKDVARMKQWAVQEANKVWPAP
mgnify:CR=1 FL=1